MAVVLGPQAAQQRADGRQAQEFERGVCEHEFVREEGHMVEQ